MTLDLMTPSLEHRLAALRSVPIFDVPLVSPTGKVVGNNGDVLIRLGAEILFKRAELNFVDDPASAQLLMMGGSGGMLERYATVPGLFRDYWSRYPDKPLWVLPTTYYFPSGTFFADLPDRSAEVLLYCRERTSYQHLLDDCHLPPCCQVFLGHDTAFNLSDSALVRQYQDRPGQHILMVERDDSEHPSRFSPSVAARSSTRRWITALLKQPLYPLREFLFSMRTTPFRQQCETILQQNHPEQAGLKRVIRDISRKDFGSFESFCRNIADAELVFTTRLHVGIFAALLGKPTYLFAGPYHKIRAIYEHSLTQFDNVTLVDWDGGAPCA